MSELLTVFGATGAQGLPVVQQAKLNGLRIRAVSRSVEGAAHNAAPAPSSPSVHERAAADFNDPASLMRALEGAAGAFVHLPIATSPDQPQRFLSNLLEACEAASLPLLVFSTSGPAHPSYRSSPLINANRMLTQALLSSRTPTIVLQPTIYLENLDVGLFVPRLDTEGVLDYPPAQPDQPVVWTSHHDQAIVAVAALKQPQHAGRAYAIGSPGPVNGLELANVLSRTRGRPIRFESISAKQFGQRVAAALKNPGLEFLRADMYEACSEIPAHQLTVESAETAHIFGVKLMTATERILTTRRPG